MECDSVLFLGLDSDPFSGECRSINLPVKDTR